ncbi:MAG: hypothetical protein RL885_04900, partial [Planctomycetota bacterium]
GAGNHWERGRPARLDHEGDLPTFEQRFFARFCYRPALGYPGARAPSLVSPGFSQVVPTGFSRFRDAGWKPALLVSSACFLNKPELNRWSVSSKAARPTFVTSETMLEDGRRFRSESCSGT